MRILKFMKNRIVRKTLVIQRYMKVHLAKQVAERVEKANNSKIARLFIACGKLDRQMSYLFGLQKLERGHWLRSKAVVKI